MNAPEWKHPEGPSAEELFKAACVELSQKTQFAAEKLHGMIGNPEKSAVIVLACVDGQVKLIAASSCKGDRYRLLGLLTSGVERVKQSLQL